MEKKHCLGRRYVMGYSNQQMDTVSSCSSTKDWQGRVVADANEIHRNRFAQRVGQQVTLFLGAEDAVDLSARIGMTHKFQHSLQLNVTAVPVTLGARAARTVSRSDSGFGRSCLSRGPIVCDRCHRNDVFVCEECAGDSQGSARGRAAVEAWRNNSDLIDCSDDQRC